MLLILIFAENHEKKADPFQGEVNLKVQDVLD